MGEPEDLLEERHLRLDANERPEFDIWRWVDFWYPTHHVVPFKRRVYEQALRHLEPLAEALCSLSLSEQRLALAAEVEAAGSSG